MRRYLAIVLTLALAGCGSDGSSTPPTNGDTSETGARVHRAAFVVANGVFNSELMAPYDILHHTVFRDSLDYVEPFVVSEDGGPVTTFEGLVIQAHYSFENAPEAEILVIPSTEGSMDRDLDDRAYMNYVERAARAATWVITVCDGAFPLAETGLLSGRVATTFPADRGAFAERYPEIDVRDDVRLVVDGKFLTSVGGAMSYEPALYVLETEWGREYAELTAEGLVWPWSLSELPHVVLERPGEGALATTLARTPPDTSTWSP